MKKNTQRNGFTLFEILVVFVILIVLFGIAYPLIRGQWEDAKTRQATVQIQLFERALQSYQMDYGDFPLTQQNGLLCLVGKGLTRAQVMGTTSAIGSSLNPMDPQGGGDATAMGFGGAMNPASTTLGSPEMGGMNPMMNPGGESGAMPGTFGGSNQMNTANPALGSPEMMGMNPMNQMDPMAAAMPADPMNPGASATAFGSPANTATTASMTQGMGAGKKYLDSFELPKDPWRTDYFYEYPTVRTLDGRPAIWSSGPDKINGNDDDVISWKADIEAASKDPVLMQTYQLRQQQGIQNPLSPNTMPNNMQGGGAMQNNDPMGMGMGMQNADPMGMGNPQGGMMQQNPMMGGQQQGGGAMMEMPVNPMMGNPQNPVMQ